MKLKQFIEELGFDVEADDYHHKDGLDMEVVLRVHCIDKMVSIKEVEFDYPNNLIVIIPKQDLST